jgi:aryl carrier-like protein
MDGTLTMTIVAQGSVFSLSQAETVLDQIEGILLITLKECGENKVLGPTTNSETLPTSHVQEAKSRTEVNSKPNSNLTSFLWTKESLQIRIEIASLANVEEIDIHEHSSIFELGLDSIDVIKLSSRLKKHDITMSVGTIIKSQSIAKMASNIHVNGAGDANINSSPIYVETLGQKLSAYLKQRQLLPLEFETVLPATPLQQTMVNEMLKSNFSRYFTLEVFALNRNTKTSKLVTAIQNVIATFPILRTRFIEVDDPKSPVSYAQVVLKSHERVAETTESNLETFLVRFKAKSMAIALSDGLLFHAQLITIEGKGYMTWAISHALYDGTSLRLLHQDIEKSYKGELVSRPDYLPFLECVLNSTTEEAKGFWKTTLSNLPPVVFPKNDVSQISGSTTVHRSEVSSRVPLDVVEKLCKTSKVTLQTLGQTCWAILLAHLMGRLDVVFGSVLSCRDSEESNEAMFPLMNTVAVRSILHGTLADMLKYMQEMSDRTRQYQHFPLGKAQALALSAQDSRQLKGTILFDTLFIYQGRRRQAEGILLYESVCGSSDVEFPVCVEMEIIDGRLTWTAACKSTARDAIEADNMIEMLDSVLHRIISTPEAPTVESDVGGISICCLPKFKISDESTQNAPRPLLATNEVKWTKTELVIRKALHEVSGVPEDLIHKDSTIFQLGLDSIAILKIPALLKVHGIRLLVGDILKHPNISSMTRTALHQDSNQTTLIDIDSILSDAISSFDLATAHNLRSQFGDIKSVLPVTPGQLYMTRMWQSSQGVLFYPSFTYSLDSSVDKARLERAWVALVQHHDILRTGFLESESGIWQIIFKSPTSSEVQYLTSQHKSRELNLETTRCDLSRPPVALVIEDSDGSSLKLKLVIHHALYDGVSLPTLMQQLQLLYQGQSLPVGLDFKTFIGKSIYVQRRASDVSSSLSLMQAQWESYLSPISRFVETVSGTLYTNTHERTEVFRPKCQVSALRQAAQNIGVSVDALLLALASKAYMKLLSKPETASIPYVVFGIYLANRAPFGEDLSSLAAPTLNVLPLCVFQPVGRRIEELAVEVQEDLQKISNKEMTCASLEDIYKWTGVRVNFIVNILKGVKPEIETSNECMFKPVLDMRRKAEVVKYSSQKNMPRTDEKCDAYLVCTKRNLPQYTLADLL